MVQIGLDITPDTPEHVRRLIMRAVRMISADVDPRERDHVAFMVSQFIQQAYWLGSTDGMKNAVAEFKSIAKGNR